jgi:prevent-host-death family protein
MRESTIREAKSSLTALIHAAEKGEPVRLTRHGKPVAVLVSEREYRRLSERSAGRDPWTFLQRWRAQRNKGFSGITDEEVDSWRDRSPEGGRKVSWDE